jgi:hypothetical protein
MKSITNALPHAENQYNNHRKGCRGRVKDVHSWQLLMWISFTDLYCGKKGFRRLLQIINAPDLALVLV